LSLYHEWEKIRHRFDRWRWLWPVLAVAALAILAAQPLLRPAITCSHDGNLYFLRLVEADHLVRHGHLYPRWAPDMAYGYGYPLFNFYAPLSWIVAETFHLLGLSLMMAWNATLILCLLACGWFAYLLARDWMPELGALVAAAAYLLAPYVLYDVYFRGNLAESVALPLLPLALWSFGRLVRSGGARYLALAAASLALLVLAHQVMVVLFGPVLLVYVLIVWRREGRSPWVAATVVTAGLLALGLSAFFWGPAFLEKEAVHIAQSFTPGGMNFRQNFLALAELFSPPVFTPQDLMNPSPPRSLSLAALALGLLGLTPLAARLTRTFWQRFKIAFPIFARDVSAEVRRAWHLFALDEEPTALRPPGPPDYPPLDYPDFQRPSSDEWRQLLLLGGALALAFMTLSPALPLWEHLPLFHWAQFPWRLLGPASLVLALMAGNSFALLPARGRWRWGVLGMAGAAIGLLLLFSLGWLYPRDCGRPKESVAAIPRFEIRTGIIGTTSAGEYLPRYVEEMPDPDTFLPQYESGGPIARLDPASLPEGTTVREAEYGLTSAKLLIEGSEPFRAVYRALYFPGWRVAVNGQNVPIVVAAPHGLISFDVPAGQAAVQVWFGTTPLRLGSGLLSGATLLMVLWLAWQGRREGRFAPGSAWLAARWWQWAALLALAGGLLWAKTTWIDAGATPLRADVFDGQTLEIAETPLAINWGDELTLLGYNLSQETVAAGESFPIELFWAARGQPTGDYAFGVRLVDERGFEWSPKGTRRPGGFHGFPKTQSWQPGEYAHDAHLIDVLPGTPPGRYALRVTAFERETLAGLDVLNDQGVPVGQSAVVGEITVTSPQRPPDPDDPDDLDAQHRLDAPLGDATLLGVSLGRWGAAPGDALHLTTFWRAGASTPIDFTALVELVDGTGQVAASTRFSPGGPQYPPGRWQAGQVIRDQQTWVLPRDLAPGAYAVRFQVWGADGTARGPLLLETPRLEIAAPERQTDLPPMQHAADANLGDRVTLLGYDLTPPAPRPGGTQQLTLYWRAEAEMAESYKVFVHWLDAEGGIRAQDDAIPAQWTRPTTGWLPGEIVVDAHQLTLESDAPPGAYLLEVGLYEEQTGTRLPLLDGAGQPVDDRVVLTTAQVADAD
jgi:hypothetical protein